MLSQQRIDISPRRPNTELLVKQWLKQRQDLLVIYSQLCEVERSKTETLQQFCQILMDYLSVGHFKMFETMAEVHLIYQPDSKGLDSKLLKRISKTTDMALDFNDKYSDLKTLEEGLEELSTDLSLLGENLAHRMDWEDKLIAAYLKFSSELH